MEKTYKILKLMIWVLVFAVLMAGAWVLYGSLSAHMTPNTLATEVVGETNPAAPDFGVMDGEGNIVRLSDFQGKPVILNFWASWCGPCKSEMPDFQTAYETYGEDIHFLMVNMADGYQETKEKGEAFVQEQGYTFPVYYDTQLEAAIAYSVTGIPATYFIDTQGHIVTAARGALSADRLQQGIELLLP